MLRPPDPSVFPSHIFHNGDITEVSMKEDVRLPVGVVPNGAALAEEVEATPNSPQIPIPQGTKEKQVVMIGTPRDPTSPSSVASGVADAIKDTVSLKGILPAFYVMEKRRMRRVLNGRFHRQALCKYTSDLSQIAIIAMLIVHFLKVDWEDISQYRQIPGIITGVMVCLKLVETMVRPEHVTAEWIRLEINLFVLWMAWEYDRQEKERRECWWTDADPCFLDSELNVIYTFVGVVGVTLIILGFLFYLLPCAVRRAFWGSGNAVWWRIRPAGSTTLESLSSGFDIGATQTTRTARCGTRTIKTGRRGKVTSFSYRPTGFLSLSRGKFGYIGETDETGCPHGIGMWLDNTYHGECLSGVWNRGCPFGTFTSREYGTGAQFAQRPVAYATSRADCQPDDLKKAWKKPSKVDKIRYGIAQVEVSLAGGFFPFLPDVQYSETYAGVAEVKKEFDTSGRKEMARDRAIAKVDGTSLSQIDVCPKLQLSVVSNDDLECLMGDFDDEPHSPQFQKANIEIWFQEGEYRAYVNRASLDGPARSLVERSKEALVFLHGYNSDIATCVGRMAQLCSLGGMADHIVPFVFSYSAGFALSYLDVKRHMSEYGDDLAAFFTELGTQFREVHILCHSCGAQFFFGNVEKILDCFAPSRVSTNANSSYSGLFGMERRVTNLSTEKVRKPYLASVTMVNPDVLVDIVTAKLPSVMDVADHFTTYNDRKDGALFWSSFVQTWLPKRMLQGLTLPAPGRHATVFGSVVSPLWFEQTNDGVHLRGPIVQLPGEKYPLFGSKDSVLQKLWSKETMKSNNRIDVIDCSTIDQNIHKLRHNYYMLNTQVVEDICELIGTRATALQRARLVQVEANVFNFLCPPADLIDL
jgi:esterase/lipase superfamily enzyme